MVIKISTRHGRLGEGTQAAIQAKVEKLPHYFDRLTEILVNVDLENAAIPRVELIAQAEHKHDLVASDAGADLMLALDNALKKLEQQIRKYKEKIQDHHRNEA